MFEKYKSGQTRIYNQICWARNYLVEAGYISKEKRGIWELTEKGKNMELTEKELIPLFKSVQNRLKTDQEESQYWSISLGENARLWEECYTKGIIAIGWDYLGDLVQYKEKEEIRQKIKEIEGVGTSKKNDVLACWQFYKEVKVGDYVFAKSGRSEVLGYGRVISAYYFDENRTEYKNTTKVS